MFIFVFAHFKIDFRITKLDSIYKLFKGHHSMKKN